MYKSFRPTAVRAADSYSSTGKKKKRLLRRDLLIPPFEKEKEKLLLSKKRDLLILKKHQDMDRKATSLTCSVSHSPERIFFLLLSKKKRPADTKKTPRHGPQGYQSDMLRFTLT
jgi:hypothetical protein